MCIQFQSSETIQQEATANSESESLALASDQDASVLVTSSAANTERCPEICLSRL